MITPLLDELSLDGAVVTADALHCQRATADYLHGRGADFILPVKDNQPSYSIPPHPTPPLPHPPPPPTRPDAPGDLPFPHVSQAYLIERHVTALDGTPLSGIAALGVTSLDATRASPQTIASLVRGQWAIESLHWLRDTLYREDNSTVRTRSGPRAMATLKEPRRRRLAPGRAARHHRSHPLGQPHDGPARHHPRTHLMIPKRPCRRYRVLLRHCSSGPWPGVAMVQAAGARSAPRSTRDSSRSP